MEVRVFEQPDDITCGPTSLEAVYNYFNYTINLQQLINEVHVLEDGGTLAVLLGIDALKRGFYARVYSYNLRIFDPTWQRLNNSQLIEKLDQLLLQKKAPKIKTAAKAYRQFLKLGGNIQFDVLRPKLLAKYFRKKLPVLTGLSATFLYQSMREYTNNQNRSVYDDMVGEPMGHFVVLCGFTDKNHVRVADPYKKNPISNDNYYTVEVDRLINAILLGIVTYDANLLILSKKPFI